MTDPLQQMPSAFKKNDLTALTKYVEEAPDAPRRLYRLYRLLGMAIWLKRNDMLEALLQHFASGLDLNSVNAGRSPLSIAASTGDLEALHLLVDQGADVNVMDHMGETALMAAAERGDAVTTEWLLKKGAVTRTQGKYGIQSAIEHAVGNGRGHWDVAHLLVEHGADPNEELFGEPLIVIAAQAGHVPLVQTLLAHGADVDAARKRRECTALMVAARDGHEEITQILLRAGADTKGPLGKLALAEAIRGRRAEIVDALLDAGADVNGRSSDSETPLVAACDGLQINIVKALLAHGADVHVTYFGKPLIVYVAEYGFREHSLDLIRALVDHGADVNARDQQGYTAWLWADAWHLTDLARLLEQYGADTHYRPVIPLPAAAQAIILESTIVETFRVDPEHQQRLPSYHIGGYAITSAGAVQSRAFADRVANLLLDHRTYMGEPMKCGFQPGVAFRLHAGTKTVEVLLCFHCHELRILTHDGVQKHEPLRAFFGQQYGNFVKLAQAAFPADQDLAALSNGKDLRV